MASVLEELQERIMRTRFLHNVGVVIFVSAPLLFLLVLWELAASSSTSFRFFFSSPSLVSYTFSTDIMSGKIILDAVYTILPTIIGLVVGVTGGCAAGYGAQYTVRLSKLLEWNILLLGSIPIFAVAPMMLIWFGIGLKMKVAMAILSTVFVSMAQAYRGGKAVQPALIEFFKLNGATQSTILRKLILPSSLDWVFSSIKLSANLALLGVFVGEFIASEHGLGRAMLNASGLYNTAEVLANAVGMMIIVIALDRIAEFIERRRFAIAQFLSVDPAAKPPH